METEENWGEAMEAMEPALEEADKLDAADIEHAFEILEGMAGQVGIAEVRGKADEKIDVEFSDNSTTIEYLNAGYSRSIDVRTSELRFYIASQIRIV